jgi:outer membrane protein W
MPYKPLPARTTLAFILFTFIWFTFGFNTSARAGMFEIGASGSYRKSNIDVNAYDEMLSLTGSLSYYFDEASALELSYTDGQSKRAISEGLPNGHTTSLFYKTVGLDFVYTFGEKESLFRPYVKVGGNYILQKRLVDQVRAADGTLMPATISEDSPALVPSAGLGFKIGLTQQLSLKFGIDMWASRPMNETPVTFDTAARVGLGWFF